MADKMQIDSIDERMEEENNSIGAHVYVNLDIVFMILILLPVKTLLRFRSVSKSWHALISDRRFFGAHIERSRTNPKIAPKIAVSSCSDSGRGNILLYLYEEGKSRPDPLFRKRVASPSNFGRLPMRPVHCDGLLLFEISNQVAFVCNPRTREIKTLPKGNQRLNVYHSNAKAGLGFVSGANVYKVARYFLRDFNPANIHGYTLGFEVFTLGVDSSWRVTAMDPPNRIHVCGDHPVSVGGAIYYKIKSFPDFRLFCFDLTCEEFKVIPIPPSLGSGDSVLGELDGDLCLFVDISRGTCKFDVWKMLKGSICNTWIQAFSVYVPSPPCFFWPYRFKPVQMRRGKLILQIHNTLVYYDFRTKSIDYDFGTAQDFATHDSFHVVSYVDSLVSFGGTRPVTNRLNRSSYMNQL